MATKLFLRNTTTNGITDTGDAVVYDMMTTAGAAVDTDTVTLTTGGTDIQWTQTAGGNSVAWISGRVPAGGFTLTTSDISGWFLESNMNDEAKGRLYVYRYQPGVPTITQLGGPFDDDVEFGTTITEMTWTANVTDTAFVENDRILVRVYATNATTMTAGTADLQFNAADATTGDSFFNIAETVAFKANAVEVAITGNQATGSVGTLGKTISRAITGNAATGAVGTLGTAISYSVAITGNAATGSVGDLKASVSIQLTGNAAIAAAGLITASIEAALTGNVATGAVGTLTPSAPAAVVIDVFADDRPQKRFKRRQEKLREDLQTAYNRVFGISVDDETESSEIVAIAKENLSQIGDTEALEVERRVLEKLIVQYEKITRQQAAYDQRVLEDEWDMDAIMTIAQVIQ